MTVPDFVTADTGMDVLTHAIEAYTSTLANDYTDGLALQAIKLVFENLVSSVKNADFVSREKCITLLQWLVWHLRMRSLV